MLFAMSNICFSVVFHYVVLYPNFLRINVSCHVLSLLVLVFVSRKNSSCFRCIFLLPHMKVDPTLVGSTFMWERVWGPPSCEGEEICNGNCEVHLHVREKKYATEIQNNFSPIHTSKINYVAKFILSNFILHKKLHKYLYLVLGLTSQYRLKLNLHIKEDIRNPVTFQNCIPLPFANVY